MPHAAILLSGWFKIWRCLGGRMTTGPHDKVGKTKSSPRSVNCSYLNNCLARLLWILAYLAIAFLHHVFGICNGK